MDAWIDTYHAVKSLARGGTHVFLTDSAVGLKEEDNLRHLVINLGVDVARSGVVPWMAASSRSDAMLRQQLTTLRARTLPAHVRCALTATQLSVPVRLNTNENPYQLPEPVADAVEKSIRLSSFSAPRIAFLRLVSK